MTALFSPSSPGHAFLLLFLLLHLLLPSLRASSPAPSPPACNYRDRYEYSGRSNVPSVSKQSFLLPLQQYVYPPPLLLPYLIPFSTPLCERPTSVDAASLRQELRQALRQGHRHLRTTTQPDRLLLFSICSETVPTPSRRPRSQEA
ncbi:hypothetical protein LZ32DRAFT_174764 [Colletotrichum eremochloae]|nr:hypothetical protein LZ32DRAFT_174764 [Colletotrichum eremochloae]